MVLFAADHDIALQGVSATGQEVTEMQVRNFVKGGGTINAFCRNAGARLSVVDVGVKNDLDDVEGLCGARSCTRHATSAKARP